MKTEYFSTWSRSLERPMEYKVYGHRGKPVLVFPTSRGRFYQYEDFGMIDAISGYIDNGDLQVWTCDGIDGETFMAEGASPHDRIRRHEQYMKYIVDELIPGIREKSLQDNGGTEIPLMATGCSLGGYHSANVFFRFPWHFDSLIALSGVYSTGHFFGPGIDEAIYLNSPIDYLANLQDDNYLARYRQSDIVICCGRGNFESQMVHDTLRMREILQLKQVPAWVDIWGEDVNHDWDWWRKQMPYFLGHILHR
jgi:esterase/lipase superfamily enzyme